MSINRFIKNICRPFVLWFGAIYPETLVRVRYFIRFNTFLSLSNPKTLNEKILYLSLRTDTTLWTTLADKYKVRYWVANKGLKDILIPIYQYVQNGESINKDLLPKNEGFVIKTSHGCGDVKVFRKNTDFNLNHVMNYFQPFLETAYGALEGGKHYMRIQPGLVVEKLLVNDKESQKYSSSMIDYKFWCFNGEPHFCMVCTNRKTKSLELLIYDKNWNAHPEYMVLKHGYMLGKLIPKPKNYERMIDICRILSKDFPCVRIDLYNINGKIYFGEMTFTSLGGMMNYYTNDFQLKAGSMIHLK